MTSKPTTFETSQLEPDQSEFGDLTNLDGMWLHINDLTGVVPTSVCLLGVDDLRLDCEELVCCDGVEPGSSPSTSSDEVELWGETYSTSDSEYISADNLVCTFLHNT